MQGILNISLKDIKSNQYNLTLNKVENITPNNPNITVTTIPINSVKARYFVKYKKYDKAIKLIESGTKANPFLFYSEILKSQIYEELGKLDSAKFYAKKAFFGLPNNQLHSSRYLNLLNRTRDKNALEETFNLLVITFFCLYSDLLDRISRFIFIPKIFFARSKCCLAKISVGAIKAT